MGITQKYKQQQQQVRIQTSENNYIKGMNFTDTPLTEGYSRVLVNFDIDSMSGKIYPRKGLHDQGVVRPIKAAESFLDNNFGFNTIVKSKVCYTSDKKDPRAINKILQSILYNTDTKTLLAATGPAELGENPAGDYFDVAALSNVNSANSTYNTIDPFIIAQPEIHGKKCIHNAFFKKPVGTFAFGNSYYTFLKQGAYFAQKQTDLPNYDVFPTVNSYTDLVTVQPKSTVGHYYKFISGPSKGTIAYYDKDGNITIWTRSEDALLLEHFGVTNPLYKLCYTKLGSEIQPDDVLLDTTASIEPLEPNKYYVCVVQPQVLNPTEASSWGYNMLLPDPYAFKCENTAINLVTILGILPYDKDGKIALTPRKNQEITLRGYYRAPDQFHSGTQSKRYYATAQKQEALHALLQASGGEPVIINADGSFTKYDTTVSDESSRKTKLDVPKNTSTVFNYGDWCTYANADNVTQYYMVIPNTEQDPKILTKYSDTTKPPASVELPGVSTPGKENKIRVRWQLRSAGAATWTDISDTQFLLSEYYAAHGNKRVPFTVTTTMPAEEVQVRLVVTDPVDKISNEEAVLSAVTIGITTTLDDSNNTLNLAPKTYSLGQCTGMCEWEQRLVLWGVPNALNTIFISDVGNPTFFPYPNNVDIFTDPIIAVHNYGNELLVLTTSALYRLTWDAEGSSWRHTLVQQNLHVTAEDTYMSCVIKNMFFFKSGEYYYMMVPRNTNTYVRGEVAIAPISKPIEHLLDNFHQEIYNLIKVIVDQPDIFDFTDHLVNYYSYTDHNKIMVNYIYDLNKSTTAETIKEDPEHSKYLYVQLIYDTDARTWSLHAFEAAHMLYASHVDAIQQDRFIDLTPAASTHKIVMQYYKFDGNTDSSIQYLAKDETPIYAKPILKNYQYLDTGNRDINTDMRKRFREFQFKIKNETATNLGFYTSFLIDGSLRKDLQHYAPRFITDPATNESLLVIERVLDTDTMTYKNTRIERIIVPSRMLQDSGELNPTILAEEQDPDRWVLNQSAFPGRTLLKIRMPLSGKGLSPRAILLSTNEKYFEILGHAWVYRTMHSR